MYNAIITKSAITRSTISAKKNHQMSFGRRHHTCSSTNMTTYFPNLLWHAYIYREAIFRSVQPMSVITLVSSKKTETNKQRKKKRRNKARCYFFVWQSILISVTCSITIPTT